VFVGLRHNLDSIKSKAKILLLWVDEAEPVSAKRLDGDNSDRARRGRRNMGDVEPRSQEERAHIRFRQSPLEGSKIIELNWRDNPFFPKILNITRLDDLKNRPDQYDWVWNGGFRTVVEGAYYSKLLLLAKEQKRIDFVPGDPLMQIRAYFDIGGTGAR
jgi:phage terminase large subunit